MALRIISSTRTPEALCPYCRSTLFLSTDISACSDCKTLHHSTCFEELKRCSVFGCNGKPKPQKVVHSAIQLPQGKSPNYFVALQIATVLAIILSIAFPHRIFSLTLLITAILGMFQLFRLRAYMAGSAFLATFVLLILPLWSDVPSISGFLSAILSVGEFIISANRMFVSCPTCGVVRRTESSAGLLQCPKCGARFAA